MLSGSRVNWKNFHPSGSKIVLSLAVLAALTGSMASQSYAASYTKGITGDVTKDKANFSDITITGKGKEAVYDFITGDHTFNITNTAVSDTESPIHLDNFETVTVNNADGTLYMNLVNTAKSSYSGVAAINNGMNDNLTINSNLDISVSSDYLADGFALTGSKSNITVNGNVKIRKDDAANPWGIVTNKIHGDYGPDGDQNKLAPNYTGARWQPTAIYNNGTSGSTITINGDFDAAVRGTAVSSDPFNTSGNSYETDFINLNGGNVTIDTPESTEESFYSLAGYGGTINVNVKDGSPDVSHKVNIKGNIIAMGWDEAPYYIKSRINLGLVNKDSGWTGVIDNGDKQGDDGTVSHGEVNVWLQNGAIWNHKSLSKTNGLQVENMPTPSKDNHYGSYDGISHVTTLHGGTDESSAGFIYQKDKSTVEIGKASGTTVIWYDHSDNTPGTMEGGDVKVLDAEAGTHMILKTGNNGITKGLSETDSANDRNNVSEILNSLAHKLWYTASNTNLTGTVEIAEGLTASALKTGTITFSTASTGTKATGQGFFDYVPAKDPVTYKTGPITAPENIGETRQSDVNGNVLIDITQEQDGPNEVTAMYNSTDSPMVVDLQGKQLALSAHGAESTYLENVYVEQGKNIKITDSVGKGKLSISSGVDGSGIEDTSSRAKAVNGIGVDSNGTFESEGDVEITAVRSKGTRDTYGVSLSGSSGVSTAIFDKSLTIHNVGNANAYGTATAGILLGGSSNGNSSSVMTVKGNLEISDVSGSDIKSMNGSVLNTSSAVIRAKADSGNHKYYALNAVKGTINLNTGDGITPGKLDVTGDVYMSDNNESMVNMNLTKGSQWTGASIINLTSQFNDPSAHMNLLLQGGQWTHETGLSSDTADSHFAGSRISKLDSNGGLIYQNSEKPITAYNYSGDTTVIYKHDSTDPTKINGGDFTIKNAAADSKITLVTGSEGITSGFKDTDSAIDRNRVSAVLNKLANKLFYSNYAKDKNLSGTVRIAEGLTSSSATAKVGKEGAITFSDGTKEGTTAGQGYYDYTPASDIVYQTGPITTSEKISETRKSDENGLVAVEATTANAENGGYVSTLYAVGAATKAAPMIVNMDGKSLSLTAASDGKIAAAVYVTDNAHIQIKNEAGKQFSIKSTNTDTRAADGIFSKGSNSDLSIQGPVEIGDVITKGDSANGILVQGQNSNVTVDGPLTIRNVYGKRGRGLGVNASGIQLTGENSTATVNGAVDISDVRGSSLKTVGANTKLSVGGGIITAAADSDKSHNYYAARVEQGTMNINMKDGQAGTTTTKITGDMYVTGQYGKKVVEYSGGELVDWSNAGVLNVALTDKDSFWTGAAAYDQYKNDYGPGGKTVHDIGQLNLYLQNGATWTNEQQSHLTTTTTTSAAWAGSQLAALHGGVDADHSGLIFQKSDKPVSINSYDGYTKVFYGHDSADPTKINGGAFKITNAAAGSGITLITDSVGISTGWKDTDDAASQKLVYNVLNNLAGKLYYGDYKDGHLKGTVELAEGLTSSSKSLKMDDISFYTDADVTGGTAKEAGWGYVINTNVPDSSDYANVPITGDFSDTADPSQKPYQDAGIVQKDGSYTFTSNTTLETKDYHSVIDAKDDVTVNAAGKVLTFKGTVDDKNNGSDVIHTSNGHAITINAKKVIVDSEQTKDGGSAWGMNTEGGNITVNGDMDVTAKADGKDFRNTLGIRSQGSTVTVNGTVTMRQDNGYAVDNPQATSNYRTGAVYATSAWGEGKNYGGTINIDKVDLKVNGNGLWSNIGGSTVNVNGGTVETNPDNTVGFFALRAECGTVNMNVKRDSDGNVTGAGENDVTVKGNVFADTGAINDIDKSIYTTINLGLTTKASSLTGIIWNGFEDEGNQNGSKTFYGRTNLWLSNGAQWNNEKYGTIDIDNLNYYGSDFTESLLNNFHGGSDEAHTGYIYQKEDTPITLKNYDGYTTVFYAHDEKNPETMIGGDLTIEKAAKGSGITLVTDSKGISAGFSSSDKAADQNRVSEVLNKLAQKLFYTANDGNLTGKVKIAEGLTASSKSLKTGDIFFSTDSTGTKIAGQGYYDYKPASDAELSDSITGGLDKKYVNLGIEKEKGKYTFTESTNIVVDGTNSYMSPSGTVESTGGNVTILAKNVDLKLVNRQKGSNYSRTVSTGMMEGHDISIEAGKLDLVSETTGFRAYGIYNTGKNINIDADTHVSTKASSKSSNSRSVYASGGTITLLGGFSNDVDTNAEFYSLYADGNGRITVNMKDGKAGGGKVNLKGDIYTESITSEDNYYDESSENSTVDMALSGKESSWHGRSVYSTSTSDDDSSKGYGDFNLILDDGAVWTNEKVGSGMDAGSHVTKLTGGAEGKSGIIVQKDKKDLTVDALSGHTEVRYEKLDGTGSLRIRKAEDGTFVVLAAVSDTKINTASHLAADYNKTGVGNALNALARKLYYTGRDNKLAGTVELVSAFGGAAVVSGTISYKPDGQGFYDYADAIDTITGIRKNNMNYVVSGILRDDGENYVFSGDDSVSVKDGNAVSIDGNTDHKVNIRDEGHTLALSSGISKEQGSSIAVSVNGGEAEITAKTLQVTAAGGDRREGIHAASDDASTPARLTVNGNLDITASDVNNQKKGTSIGIYAKGNADVVVNGNVNMKKDNLWAVSGKGFNFYGASGLNATSNMGTNSMGSSITVNGDTVMKVDGNGVFANVGGSIVTLNGRTDIEVNKDTSLGYAALRAEDGTINVNVNRDAKGAVTGAGTHDVVIKGNVAAETGAVNSVDKRGTLTQVNLGLSTAGSSLTGTIYNGFPSEGKTEDSLTFKGETNLWLANGAVWNNEEYGKVINAWGGEAYTGSRVTNFYGKGGFILQNDKNPIAVDHYSGDTTVIYRHEIKDNEGRDHASLYGNKEASIMGGGFKITNAAENSTITLLTDNAGVNTASTDYRDQNLVYDLMDKLAGKLYYSGYADGHLKGIVKIAEGLTASSAMMKMGDISFYTEKDEGKTAGEGYYKYNLVYPSEQVVNPMDKVIDGSEDSRNNYRDAGVYHDETESYDFTSKTAEVTASDHDDGVVHAKDNDAKVTTKDWLHVTAKDGGVGMASENRKTVSTEGNTQITAKDGIGVKADKGTVSLKGHTIISAGTGMEAVNGGTISADGTTDMTAGEGKNALHADGDGSTISLKDGTISGAVLAENKGSISTAGAVLKGAATASKEGTIHLDGGSTSEGITADGGTIYTAGTDVKGEALAKAKGTLSMTGGNAGAVTADGGSASTDGTAVKGLLSAKNGGSITMTNGSAKGLSIDKDSAITAKLDKKDASIQGDIANEGTASLTLGGGASWIGDSTGSGKTNASIGEGSTWTGASINGNTRVALEGTWKQTGNSTVDALTGKGGTLDKSADGAGETEIAKYSGIMSILYSHNEFNPTEINGAVTTVEQAADGSSISLVTDSKGLYMNSRRVDDRNTVSETFNQLAHKLHYTANDGKLAGTLKIAEGLTSSSAALRTEDITFDKNGIGNFIYDPAKNDIAIEYGSDETRMMKGTKSALLGSAMMWRGNNNDIQRRMGDLRLGQGETGVWARYIAGKNRYDQQNTYLNQDYDIGQAGFDKKVGDWTVGLALDHGDGKAHYIGGKGKEKMNSLAVYGTRVSNDGRYFDVIVKTGQVKNKFDVSNEIGNKLHGDYKAWGNSISLEYGKRFVQDSGFYMDPSVEFTAGRLNGKNFKGTSDLGTLYVHQHGFNSAIGRIGFSIGRQLPKSSLYAKLALAHEFAGDFKTDFYADDGGLKSTKVDLSDTWLDMELGGSLSLGKNVYLYGTYTRTFEADMATKWRADVGVRYTF